MRIMGMLKGDESTEANQPPSLELMQRMGDFIEEVTKAGVLIGTEGLHPTVKGKRVKLENGKVSVIDGPFTESKEVVASYAFFQVDTMDEAVHWTTRFLEVLGRGECELRPIFEASDFAPELFPPAEQEREARVRAEMAENAQR